MSGVIGLLTGAVLGMALVLAFVVTYMLKTLRQMTDVVSTVGLAKVDPAAARIKEAGNARAKLEKTRMADWSREMEEKKQKMARRQSEVAKAARRELIQSKTRTRIPGDVLASKIFRGIPPKEGNDQ